MENSKTRNELSSSIKEIIQKFEETSGREIKQKDLARGIGVSESTLTKAKSPIYKMPINTLRTIKDNLEELLEEYGKSPENVRLKLQSELDSNSSYYVGRTLKVIALILFLLLLLKYCIPLEPEQVVEMDEVGIQEVGEFHETDFTDFPIDKLDSIDGNSTNGWLVKDKDSKWLYKYKDSSGLWLATLPGDYYKLRHEDSRIEKIRNLLYRKINCGECCSITIKMSGFHPTGPHQQAGFFLFYSEEIDPRYYTRLTYSYKGDRFTTTDSTEILPIFYDYNSKDFSTNEGPRYITPLSLPTRIDTASRTDDMWLKIDIKEGVYVFSYKRNKHMNHGWTKVGTANLNLPSPEMIALGAWQGHSVSHHNVYLVDTLTVAFNSVIITPCMD